MCGKNVDISKFLVGMNEELRKMLASLRPFFSRLEKSLGKDGIHSAMSCLKEKEL